MTNDELETLILRLRSLVIFNRDMLTVREVIAVLRLQADRIAELEALRDQADQALRRAYVGRDDWYLAPGALAALRADKEASR